MANLTSHETENQFLRNMQSKTTDNRSAARKPSIDLLKSLSEKLKVANLQSPFLKAVAGRLRNRLNLQDLIHLSDTKNPPKEFIASLLGELPKAGFRFELQINPNNQLNKELNQLKDAAFKRIQFLNASFLDDIAEHGTRSFGLGFPIISLRSQVDPKRIVTAPILIWYLEINALKSNHQHFAITRNEDKPIILNPQLINFLRSDRGIRLTDLPDHFMDDGIISPTELQNLLEIVAKDLGVNWEIDSESDINSVVEPQLATGEIALQWAGIFSLFKSTKESIIQDYDTLVQNYDQIFSETRINIPFQRDFFASVPLDPSQEMILRTLSEHEQIIIQGPPGTGKSNSLTGILLNALEHQVKCLVVCEKRTAMEVLQQNLADFGLGHLVVLIDDVYADRQPLVKQLRELIDNKPFNQLPTFGQHQYQHTKQLHQQNMLEQNAKLKNTTQPILGDFNWKQTIGLQAEALLNLNGNVKLILDSKALQFTTQEYNNLLDMVRESARLFEQLPSTEEHLKSLSNQWLREPYSRNLHQQIALEIDKNIEKINNLQSDLNELQSNYQANKIQEALLNSFFTKIKALFSGQTKVLIAKTQQFATDLKTLKLDLENIVINNQNNKTDVNLVTKWPKLLENWQNTLSKLQSSLIDLPNFHPWQQYYNSHTTDYIRQLVDMLKKNPTSEWETQFNAWYFDSILAANETKLGQLPDDERHLQALQKLEKELTAAQHEAITFHWNEMRKRAMAREQIQSLKLLFNLRKNNTFSSRTSLRYIFGEKLDFVTDFFPVLMVSPNVASSIIPLKPGLFQIVMFDEASQLKVEDTLPSLIRGKIQVVSGDMHQMPPSNHFQSQNIEIDEIDDADEDVLLAEEESLLNFAQTTDFHLTYLDFHYRSQHPKLIDFSNAAFYGDRLVPMPPRANYKPIYFRHIDGLNINNTNPKECDAILNILANEIAPNEKGDWPSIGIATFNQMQQNYIREQIWNKADKESEFARKLEELEKAGLFVKNLENIQGDQRDIIIISTTFGPKTTGTFAQRYGPINQSKGYKLLNVIVTRAKTKLYVVTSVPKNVYQNYKSEIEQNGNTGKGIFYAYLNYAELCDNDNETGRQNLLTFLSQNTVSTKSVNNLNTNNLRFEETIFRHLKTFCNEQNIKIGYKYGGFYFDIAIVDDNNTPKAIVVVDGKPYHKTPVAYRHELHQQSIMERYKIPIYRLWSTRWWRSPQKELAGLRQFIQNHANWSFIN